MMALSPLPGSFQIDATVGGGGHAVRILEAANPDGRLLGLDADQAAIAQMRRRAWRRSATGSMLRQANFEDIARGRREASASTPVDGILLRPRAELLPAGRRRARLQLPLRAGRSTCASTPTRGRPASELAGDLDEEALRASCATLRRGAARAAHRPRHRRRSGGTRRSRPRRSWRRSSSASSRRRAAGRRRIHPATRTFQALRIAVNRELEVLPRALEPRPSTCCDPAAGSSSSPTTRSRTASSSASWPRERRGCICPPELPVCVCGRPPRLRGRSARRRASRATTRSPPTPVRAALGSGPPSGSRHEGAIDHASHVIPPSTTAPSHASQRTTPGHQEGSIVSRHQSRRRRTYGRRQHELHERTRPRRQRPPAGRSTTIQGADDADDLRRRAAASSTSSRPRMRFLEGRG